MWHSDYLPPWCRKPWDEGGLYNQGPWYDIGSKVDGKCSHCGGINTTGHARETTRNWLRRLEQRVGYRCSQCRHFSSEPPQKVQKPVQTLPQPPSSPVYGPRRPMPQIFSPEAVRRATQPIFVIPLELPPKRKCSK